LWPPEFNIGNLVTTRAANDSDVGLWSICEYVDGSPVLTEPSRVESFNRTPVKVSDRSVLGLPVSRRKALDGGFERVLTGANGVID
jgi:hypothetical protein